MNYVVVWLTAAETELAAVWVASPRQAEVTAAVANLDQHLATDPSDLGESRDQGRRIAFSEPIAMLFRVYENSKTVVVTQVWDY